MPDRSSTPLEDHGVVGDGETVAIVQRSGSVDWFCWPRIDSPSVFGALLDEHGGAWSLHPDDEVLESRQVYLSGTNVLLTRFHVPSGIVEVEDFMTVAPDAPGAAEAAVDRDRPRHLVRVIRCRRGSAVMSSRLQLEPDYGRATVDVARHDDGRSIRCTTTGDHPIDLVASSSHELGGDDGVVTARIELSEGDVAFMALGDEPLDEATCRGRYDETVRFWRDWTERCTYRGRWREHVERSALALKLLTHRPTGGIVAAATTSLPETIGGSRNWDYRYVWIRDAAFTLYAFIELGHVAEARAFTNWLVERVRTCDTSGERPPLSPLYDLDGDDDLDEIELDHWSGYADSRPVRIGNAASGQLQLDIYGEMIDALYLADKHGDGLDLDTWSKICVLVEWVTEHWHQPDEGMWETRAGREHHTSSVLMCWVAVERAIRMAQHRGRPAPLERWRTARDEMHRCLMEEGWNDELGSFVRTLGGDDLDAALLLMPLVKFLTARDQRWLSTLDTIGGALAHGPLVDRYDLDVTDDGLDGDEGSFTICSFWFVENLARAGRVDEARAMFDRLLSYASPTGLFSEQIGADGRQLGNTPQAFTHLAVISAAVHLDEALP